MKNKILLIAVALSVLIGRSSSSNILFLSPIASPSHHIYNSALVYELASKGHNLTFLSADLVATPPKNVHYIHVENLYEFANQFMEQYDFFVENPNEYKEVYEVYEFMAMTCDVIFKSEGVKQLLNYPDNFKFDLIIYDYTMIPCILGVLPKFNYPPLIGVSAFSNPPYTLDVAGGERLGLTVKPYFSLYYDKDMNIFQRLNNGFLNFFDHLCFHYIGLKHSDKVIKEHFPNSPDTLSLMKRTTLALVNSHPTIDHAESLPPNVIEVGGLQIKEPKPLDKEIDEFLSKGKKGSVLMSLGSNVRSDMLKDRIDLFIQAFKELPDYNFLWKFESPQNLEGKLPPNVMIKKWLKQNDILGHKNLKAFMSHSGLLSTHEATYHGVPIIGIPFFADQHRNLYRSMQAGVANKIDVTKTSVKEIKAAILEVLNDSKFKENSLKRSKMFKDRPHKPLDTAVWWCEFLLRNPDSSHLKQNEFSLPIFGAYFWDIKAIIAIEVLVISWVLKKLVKKVIGGKGKKDLRKKNQ